MESFTVEEARRILRAVKEIDEANVAIGKAEAPFEVQVIELDLSTARLATAPYRVGFPFRSIFVADASDSTAEVSFRPTTMDALQGAVPLKKNDSMVFPQQQSGGYLHWDAQSGKTMTLVIFVTGEFRSGSQISQTGGGVAIVDGSTAEQSNATISATAASLLAADPDRKKAIFVNYDAIDMYIGGDSSVTANGGATKQGLIVPANGGEREWNSTAACYQISGTGAAGTADKVSIHTFY